jgi:hypothetical protein
MTAPKPKLRKERLNVVEEKALGRDEKAHIFRGAAISHLAAMFEMNPKTVRAKIETAGVKPTGTRGGYDTYKVKDVAPFLVKFAGDIEQYLRKMHPSDLPPLLQKEFWNGLRARQQYELAQGDLWRTADVIEHFGETFKVLRMNLLLLSDAVERETALSERQREIVKSRIDGALEQIRVSLVQKFGTPAGPPAEEPGSDFRDDGPDDDDIDGYLDDLDDEL